MKLKFSLVKPCVNYFYLSTREFAALSRWQSKVRPLHTNIRLNIKWDSSRGNLLAVSVHDERNFDNLMLAEMSSSLVSSTQVSNFGR